VEVISPRGPVYITVKTSAFTPLQNGNLTVLKADVIDVLE
jgi:hypothetical protein